MLGIGFSSFMNWIRGLSGLHFLFNDWKQDNTGYISEILVQNKMLGTKRDSLHREGERDFIQNIGPNRWTKAKQITGLKSKNAAN